MISYSPKDIERWRKEREQKEYLRKSAWPNFFWGLGVVFFCYEFYEVMRWFVPRG